MRKCVEGKGDAIGQVEAARQKSFINQKLLPAADFLYSTTKNK